MPKFRVDHPHTLDIDTLRDFATSYDCFFDYNSERDEVYIHCNNLDELALIDLFDDLSLEWAEI